jgi:hypothetical protein
VTSVLSNAQTISVIYQMPIDSLTYHKIQDVQLNDGSIFILGSTKKNEIKTENYLLTKVNFEGDIISQHKITAGRFDFLRDISVGSAGIVISGGTWNKDDEGTTDFIGLYDSELNLIWQRQLENKWEGSLISVQSGEEIIAATNSNGTFIYKLNLLGQIIKKQRIPSMQADGLFRLPDSNLLLVTMAMNSMGETMKELITLSPELEIVNKSNLMFDKKDYLKNTYIPDHIKSLEDGKIAALWSGKPPITTFSTPFDSTFLTIKHIRHDISFSDIETFTNHKNIYSGKLGKEAAIFVIEGNKISSKVTFGTMGIWSTNELFRISESDYIMVTDKIRTNDFETNVEVIRVKIE